MLSRMEPHFKLRNGVDAPLWPLLPPQMRRTFRTKRLVSGRQQRIQRKAQKRWLATR